MINEERTFEDFGYVSGDLSRGSHKKVWAICEECLEERVMGYYLYLRHNGRCKSCGRKSILFSNRGPFNIEYFCSIQKSIDDGKINEYRTFNDFEYYSIDLTYGSKNRVWRICIECGREDSLAYKDYMRRKNICRSCARKGERNHNYGTHLSDEVKFKLSQSLTGKACSDETKRKISESTKGRVFSKEHKENMAKSRVGMRGMKHSEESKRKMSENNTGSRNGFYGKKHSDTTKQKISAVQQGIEYSKWKEFITNNKYCPRFNNNIKEYIRNKYNRKCFMCSKGEEYNIPNTSTKYRKLSVHHVDRNKNQGCNEVDWILVPVCMQCHIKVHSPKMESYITYIIELEKSEEGYKY